MPVIFGVLTPLCVTVPKKCDTSYRLLALISYDVLASHCEHYDVCGLCEC